MCHKEGRKIALLCVRPSLEASSGGALRDDSKNGCEADFVRPQLLHFIANVNQFEID